MRCQRVAILGSTGSIGVNTLKVLDHLVPDYKVVALSANNSIDVLSRQVQRYQPEFVSVSAPGIAQLRVHRHARKIKFFDVTEVDDMVNACRPDIVVLAISGSAALAPFLAAVRLGIKIAPANKEALVMAGVLLRREAQGSGATIVPIDSEQSAIFQCLLRDKKEYLRKVILTASGGPLYKVPRQQFSRLTVAEILRHPRWKMGKKITVDSATLMNKGFEVIEAQMLFDLSMDQIDVLVHPEAIIHSMVEWHDGSILAQLSETDMRLPIQYALTYPERRISPLKGLDFSKWPVLHFDQVDGKKFPCLDLAFRCARQGGTLPCVLNAADEIAVQAFLEGKLAFVKIFELVERVIRDHKNIQQPSLKDIFAADRWAKEQTTKYLG